MARCASVHAMLGLRLHSRLLACPSPRPAACSPVGQGRDELVRVGRPRRRLNLLLRAPHRPAIACSSGSRQGWRAGRPCQAGGLREGRDAACQGSGAACLCSSMPFPKRSGAAQRRHPPRPPTDVVGDAGGEEHGLLADGRQGSAPLGAAEPADVLPRQRDAARVWGVEPLQQGGHGGLAGARAG